MITPEVEEANRVIEQARELDTTLMRPMFVFRMASARLTSKADHVKGYYEAARKQQLKAAREIDDILSALRDA